MTPTRFADGDAGGASRTGAGARLRNRPDGFVCATIRGIQHDRTLTPLLSDRSATSR